MRTWFTLGAGVGVVGMLVVGCSSGPVPNADVETFCSNKAAAECQVALNCGSSTIDACVAEREPICITDAEQATASGTRSYSQPHAAACISAVQSAYSTNSPIPFSTLQDVDQKCEQVFPGTVAKEGSCTTDFDCQDTSDVCAPVEVGSSTKQCWPLMPVSEGDPCGSVGDVCATGTYCTGVPPVCEVGGTAATGATCTPTIGCAADDYCQIDAGAKKGKCIQAGSMGTTCATDVNCAAAAPYCDVNVPPKSGKGPGSCQTGLFASFGTDTEDCKAFGGGK